MRRFETPSRRTLGRMPAVVDRARLRAVSDAVAKLFAIEYGQRPRSVTSYVIDDTLLCVMEGVLSPLERRLARDGRTELVRDLRMAFHAVTERDLSERVATLIGIRVRACSTSVVFHPEGQTLRLRLETPVRAQAPTVETGEPAPVIRLFPRGVPG